MLSSLKHLFDIVEIAISTGRVERNTKHVTTEVVTHVVNSDKLKQKMEEIMTSNTSISLKVLIDDCMNRQARGYNSRC